jgi:hypothetical protein
MQLKSINPVYGEEYSLIAQSEWDSEEIHDLLDAAVKKAVLTVVTRNQIIEKLEPYAKVAPPTLLEKTLKIL